MMVKDNLEVFSPVFELKPKLEEIIIGGVSMIQSKPFEDNYLMELSNVSKEIKIVEEAKKITLTVLHQERTAEASNIVTSKTKSLVDISPSLPALEKELDNLVQTWNSKQTDDNLLHFFNRLTPYNQLCSLHAYLGNKTPLDDKAKISSFYQEAQSLKMLADKDIAQNYLQEYQQTSSSLSLNKFQTDFEENFWKVLEAKRSTISKKYTAQKHSPAFSSSYKLLSAEPIALFRELRIEAKKAESNFDSLLNLKNVLAHYESLLSAKDISMPSSTNDILAEQLQQEFPLYTASLAQRYKTVRIELRLLREEHNYRQKSFSALSSLESQNGEGGNTYNKNTSVHQRKVEEKESLREIVTETEVMETVVGETEIKSSPKQAVRTESSAVSKTTEQALFSPRDLINYAYEQLPHVQGEVHKFCALVAGYDGRFNQLSWKKRFAQAGTMDLLGLEGREKEVYLQLKNGVSKYVVV